MWMNFLLRTLAWQTLLEKNGVINGILNWLHLPSQSMINTPSAIVLGMVYNFQMCIRDRYVPGYVKGCPQRRLS